mmetsp:Transcript_25711/g.70864  ORF Transcript_25711/g.70864 Transcript_25711/m.70864 type:complete len:149 (-) Transcript_25711:150-596(-)
MMRRPAPARPAARPASTAARPAAKPAPAAPAPAPQNNLPAQPQSSGGGMLSGLASTVAQGMAFGTGSAIAHRAVGAVANSMSGGGEAAPEQAPAPEYAQGAMQQQQDVCATDKQMYYDCLKDNKDDGAVCNFLLEQLKACQQNQMYAG